MIDFLIKIAANAAAVYLAHLWIDGFTFSGSWFILAGIGLLLTLNAKVVYPIVKIIAFPVVLLSFGLFGALVNAAALWLIAYFIPQLTIDGLVPLLLATAIVSFANVLTSRL